MYLKRHKIQDDYKSNSNFIFIVGSSRSGTTLLNGILNNHPEILTFNELHFFDLFDVDSLEKPLKNKDAIFYSGLILARIDNDVWETQPLDDHTQKAKEIFKGYNEDLFTPLLIYLRTLDFLCEKEGKKYVVDQSGRNIIYEDLLLKLIPNAKFLQMIRDSRAICYSQKKRLQKRWKGGDNIPLRNSIRVFINYHPLSISILWKKYSELGKKLVHQANRHFIVKYEELVTNPKKVVSELCKFLNISYSQNLLNVQLYGSSHAHQKIKEIGISTDSIDLWKNKLSSGEIFLINFFTKTTLKNLTIHYKNNQSRCHSFFGYLFIPFI